MIQDIVTYTVILYAAAYTVRGIAMIFLTERKPVNSTSCSSCSGCPSSGECPLPGAHGRHEGKRPPFAETTFTGS